MNYQSAITITVISAIIFGYFFGSIMTSELVKRIYKVDPRTHFSRNPGATNAVRTFGVTGGVIVLLGDMLKVVLATLIVWAIYQACFKNLGLEYTNNSSWIIYLTTFFATVGHALPIFFKFKGGKCVSTFYGALIIISPWIAIICMLTFIFIALVSKYVSLASIISSFLGIVLVFVPSLSFFYLLQNFIDHGQQGSLWWATYTLNTYTIISISIILLLQWIILVIRHHENILKLIHHNENKIGKLCKRKNKMK